MCMLMKRMEININVWVILFNVFYYVMKDFYCVFEIVENVVKFVFYFVLKIILWLKIKMFFFCFIEKCILYYIDL